MRDEKGIRNSKFEMRKLEENAHAKAAKPRQEYGAQTRIAKDVSILCRKPECS